MTNDIDGSAASDCSSTVVPWEGDPIYMTPSRCNDDNNTYRIFHRDKPGRIVAEFYGENAGEMAEHFCKLFGEPSGSKR